MTNELLRFLMARLDFDENMAKVTLGEPAAPQMMRDWSARVLREVESKRRTIHRATAVIYAFDHGDGMWPDVTRRERSHANDALLDLAAVYSNHPDYREEWRP